MSVIYDAKNFVNILKKFQLDKKFVRHVLARNPDLYPYLDIKFKNKKKYLKIALNAQRPDIYHLNHSKYGIWVHRTITTGDLLLAAPKKLHTLENLYKAALLGLSTLDGYTGPMNAEIARKLVEHHIINYNALHNQFKNNDLIIRTTIRKYPRIIQEIDTTHEYYLAYVKIALQLDGGLIEFISKELWTDELICIALKSSGYAYNLFSSELRNNEQWIKIALKQAGEIYTEIPSIYKSNTEMIWLALKNKPAIYEHLPTAYKNDIEICEYVYTKLPRMMEFMPKKCLINHTKITKALNKDGLAWEFLPYKLKQDYDLINIAESQNPLILAKIYEEKGDKFPLEYIKMRNKENDLYSKLPIFLRNDTELALDAIKLNIDNIYFLPVALMKNDKFMQKVYKIFRKECKRQWIIFKHNCNQLIT